MKRAGQTVVFGHPTLAQYNCSASCGSGSRWVTLPQAPCRV
jgi:hypothetical protein